MTHELDEQEKAEAQNSQAGEKAADKGEEIQESTQESAAPVADAAQADVATSPSPNPLQEEIDEAPESLTSDAEEPPPSASEDDEDSADDLEERQPLDVELQPMQNETTPDTPPSSEPSTTKLPAAENVEDNEPLYDDPSDEDDGEGEWITPSNVGLHKSRALDLLPSEGQGRKGKAKAQETILVGCMTADFAMQNVLLQMGLGLVGVEGKRIERVKSWVLRCHACFKYVRLPRSSLISS